MDSTNVFSPQDLTIIVLWGITNEQIHRKVTFISSHGQKCFMKEKSFDLPSNLHLDSLLGGTKDLTFGKNDLLVYFSKSQSSENIAFHEVVLEHIDIEISSVSNTMSDMRDIFQEL